MPILPDRIYRGEIHRAAMRTLDKQDGGATKFLKLRIKIPDEGFIDHELYFTPNAIANTKKTLTDLNAEIWDGTFPFLFRGDGAEKYLVGRPCRITTKWDVYEDKEGRREEKVKVQFLNGVNEGRPANEDDIQNLLAMMGIEDNPDAVASKPTTGSQPIADNEHEPF